METETTIERVVVLKALKKRSWSGFHRFPKCKDSVVASFDRGGYNTGLSTENQERLEKELGLERGTLGPNSKYWKEYAVHIADKDLVLDLSKARDFLDYCLLKNSPRVAVSVNELDARPKADYVIHDSVSDAKVENVKVHAKKKAWKKFSTMTIAEMKDFLKVIGEPAGGTDEIVENRVQHHVENKPDMFNNIVNDKRYKDMLFVKRLVHVNVLRQIGSKYIYGDDTIGNTLDEAIVYINDPANNQLMIGLKAKLETTEEVNKKG